jgi:hypothetical protein
MRLIISENQLQKIIDKQLSEIIKLRKSFQGSPLNELRSSLITNDGKYIISEGIVYSTLTGERVLNEDWSLSDILHTAADFASVGFDFIVPGSGAIIDSVNAMSYFIEAYFTKDTEKQRTLIIMGMITAAFIVIPGALQAVAPILKSAVKTGKGLTSTVVVGGLRIIGASLGYILRAIPNLFRRVIQTSLGKRMLGKYSNRFYRLFSRLESLIRKTFGKFGDVGKPLLKQGTESAAKVTVSKGLVGSAKLLLSRLPSLSIKRPSWVLRKLGFVKGGTYHHIIKDERIAYKILDIGSDGKIKIQRVGPISQELEVHMSTWIQNVIGAPWLRRGWSTLIPLFVKRFSDMITSSGGIDESLLEQYPDLDPSLVSQQTAEFTEEVASYEGDSGKYSQQNSVMVAQNALMNLGYPLTRFGVDGRFGPETRDALTKFQNENGLENSVGKLDVNTIQKMVEILKSKKPETTELQNQLSSLSKKNETSQV